MYTACVCALLLDFFFTSSSSRCANKTKVVSGFCFLTAGTKSVFCCFLKSKKNASIFVFSKTHNLHAIHALFLRIVSARNLLLSSERDTASGIYAHKEVRAL